MGNKDKRFIENKELIIINKTKKIIMFNPRQPHHFRNE
jgi:hypothetical protein